MENGRSFSSVHTMHKPRAFTNSLGTVTHFVIKRIMSYFERRSALDYDQSYNLCTGVSKLKSIQQKQYISESCPISLQAPDLYKPPSTPPLRHSLYIIRCRTLLEEFLKDKAEGIKSECNVFITRDAALVG